MGLNSKLITVYVVIVACVIIGHAKIYERCELARELRDVHEIPDNQLATWVCIARHESEYNTSAINPGSGDHGLLQISQLFWCSPPGYACGVSCDDFRNDDIEDDVICARRVYREHKRLSGDGFNAWVVYGLYCRDKQYANAFLDGCFPPGVLRTSEHVDDKPLPTVNYYPHISWKTTAKPLLTTPTPITTTERKTTINTEFTTFKPVTTTPFPTKVSKIKFTKAPFITTSFDSTDGTDNTKKVRFTTKPTIKSTKHSNIQSVTTQKFKLSTGKPSVFSSSSRVESTTKKTILVSSKQGKPLRPTEENDEFTYAISKTGYKFTRF